MCGYLFRGVRQLSCYLLIIRLISCFQETAQSLYLLLQTSSGRKLKTFCSLFIYWAVDAIESFPHLSAIFRSSTDRHGRLL